MSSTGTGLGGNISSTRGRLIVFSCTKQSEIQYISKISNNADVPSQAPTQMLPLTCLHGSINIDQITTLDESHLFLELNDLITILTYHHHYSTVIIMCLVGVEKRLL